MGARRSVFQLLCSELVNVQRVIGNRVAPCLSVNYSANKCKSSLFLQALFAHERTTFLTIFLCKASKGVSEKGS